MNKQLKIWKDDFSRYYNRTSILVRILIGAALSFAVAYILIHKVIKVQNGELKKLKQKYEAMEVIDDVEIQVADLKNKQRKSSMQLEALKKVNASFATESGTLSKGEVGKNILDLRYLIDQNRLRILSEERIVIQKKSRRAISRKEEDDRVKITFPGSMSCESYQFKILGSYQNLRHFFMAVRKVKSLFFIDNIKLEQSKELLTDKNLNQYRALECAFEVHVPFYKEEKNE